jgi:hypothetical protein
MLTPLHSWQCCMRAGRSVIKLDRLKSCSPLIYHMKIAKRIEPMANVKKRVIGGIF